MAISKMCLNRNVILKRTFWKNAFKNICAYSQGALVMAVFVQDGVPVLVCI